MARDLNGSPCPNCMLGIMRKAGENTGGFSGKKALVGAVVAGPIGLAAGALGKKRFVYVCNKCGYQIQQ